ncbi:MAG: hypothetical protein ABI947_27400 [Chloroflexota bacterium]
MSHTTAEMKESAWRNIDSMNNRVRKGLGSNSISFSHRPVFDKRGHQIGIALNEQYTQFWQDFATLFLEGIAWNRLGREMRDRFGYTRNGLA